jgi:hypothetical protein
MATGGWALGTVPACSSLSRDNAPTFGIKFVIGNDPVPVRDGAAGSYQKEKKRKDWAFSCHKDR